MIRIRSKKIIYGKYSLFFIADILVLAVLCLDIGKLDQVASRDVVGTHGRIYHAYRSEPAKKMSGESQQAAHCEPSKKL